MPRYYFLSSGADKVFSNTTVHLNEDYFLIKDFFPLHTDLSLNKLTESIKRKRKISED